MEREFWLERWRRDQLGWHLEQPNPHLVDLWHRVPVAPGARVLVPLCGKSRDLAWLADRGHPVVGVEISDRAVQAFFRESTGFRERSGTPEAVSEGRLVRHRAGRITILQGDFFDLTPEHPGPVDAVYDRGSLIALPPRMRREYVKHLEALFPDRPPILLITLDYPPEQMDGPPFPVTEEEVRGLFGGNRPIQPLRKADILAQSPRFREKGLTSLHEHVFLLTGDC